MKPITLSAADVDKIYKISLRDIAIHVYDEVITSDSCASSTIMEVYGTCAKLTVNGNMAYLVVPRGFIFRGTSAGSLGPITYYNITDEEFGFLIDKHKLVFEHELKRCA